MFKKLWGLCVMMVLLAVLPVGVQAGEGIIRVLPSLGGDMILGGSVTLYRVGDPVEGGFRLTEGLANWVIRGEDAFGTDLPRWLTERLRGTGITRSITGAEGAVFEGLEDGLYLLAQPVAPEGCQSFSSFMVSLPLGENREIFTYPKLQLAVNPKTGDHPAPIIGAMGLALSFLGLMGLWEKRKK